MLRWAVSLFQATSLGGRDVPGLNLHLRYANLHSRHANLHLRYGRVHPVTRRVKVLPPSATFLNS
jgi:hypothetical protein